MSRLYGVSSVVTILDVPLLRSPPVPLKELKGNVRTLTSPGVDRKLAETEFRESPLYRDLLVSSDLRVTALQVNLKPDEGYNKALRRRNFLRGKKADGALDPKEAAELKDVSSTVRRRRDQLDEKRHAKIATVRAIIDRYRSYADLHLGGLPMIADDMITFIENDLRVFGLGLMFFLILALGVIFRGIRWVVLPMLCCAFSTIIMTGLLGLLGWEVTVISSNFVSLQLIITMSLTIHLIVRYRELADDNPEADHRALVLETVRSKFKPCLFTSLTTIAGFGSLLVSDILPVINFGWMMSVGLVVSLLLVFLLFPAALVILPKAKRADRRRFGRAFTSLCARFTEAHGGLILLVSFLVLVITVVGITRLSVENCFINYFRKSTEIYRGLKLIDEKLGGTTPLDVVVKFEDSEETPPAVETAADDEFNEFDEFDAAEDDDKYWLTTDKIDLIVKIHDYLDGLPETGKVLSLGTMTKIVEQLNEGARLDNFEVALLYKELPQEFRDMVLKPYLSVEDREVRLTVRIKDSEKSLKRDALLKRIQFDLENKLGLKKDRFRLTSMMVLYNNMLQSLFRSQILTIGVVIFALLTMFMILFRSLRIALIAIFPNVLSSVVVLGVMGLAGIPLDMMTITIVAISIGIAVDDTIHYIHRFGTEFKSDRSYINTVHRCHGTIGNAMYYTSLTIVLGFSILSLSNFIPSVLFGLLTGLAMIIALVAALTLLPRLIILFKPFGPEGRPLTLPSPLRRED